jgi:hypothetical protein
MAIATGVAIRTRAASVGELPIRRKNAWDACRVTRNVGRKACGRISGTRLAEWLPKRRLNERVNSAPSRKIWAE